VALGACPIHASTLARAAWCARAWVAAVPRSACTHHPWTSALMPTMARFAPLYSVQCLAEERRLTPPLRRLCAHERWRKGSILYDSSVLFRIWEARLRLPANGPSLLCQLVSCIPAHAPLGEQRQLRTSGTAKSCGGQLEVSVLLRLSRFKLARLLTL
jgi:hypothetical protein